MSKTKPKPNTQDGFYKYLYENYTGLLDHMRWMQDIEDRGVEEMRYLSDFIHYKNLDEEYDYFRVHAHEEDRPDRFYPTYVL